MLPRTMFAIKIYLHSFARLKQRNFIRKSIAVLLVLVFAISATPKIFFHELLANHKDYNSCNDPANSPVHLHKQSVNCHYDDLVVRAPYLYKEVEISFISVQVFASQQACYLPIASQHCFLYKEGRGPPLV